MLSPIRTTQNILSLPALSVSVGVNPLEFSVSPPHGNRPAEKRASEIDIFPESAVPWLIEVQELLTKLVNRNANLRRAAVTDAEYKLLSSMMDDFIWSLGQDEEHPLAGPMACVGTFMISYEKEHFPIQEELWQEIQDDAEIEEFLAKNGAFEPVPKWTEEEIAIDAFCYIGSVMSAAGRGENAIAAYTTVLRLKPDDAAAYCNRGSAHYAMGNHQSAMQDYNEAVRLKPERLEGYFNRAVTHFQMQNYAAAIRDYDEALSRKPDYADAYIGRGHANFAMHRYDAAIRDYDEAARLEPNNGTARRYREIAQTHSEKGDLRG